MYSFRLRLPLLDLTPLFPNKTGGDATVNFKIVSTPLASNDELQIVGYHVEERINMKFGGRVTTYTVQDLSLINTNDLGANNTRIVTPKYGRKKPTPVTLEQVDLSIDSATAAIKPVKVAIIYDRERTASINILKTYERVLEKGYETVDMLKRVADAKFFEGDLEAAAKWYIRLFALTTDLEAPYYYRYAQSLQFIGQTEKAAEMLAMFDSKCTK